MSVELRAAAALLGAVLTWGLTLPLTKVVLGDFTPAQVAFLRLVFALPVLLALGWSARQLRVPLRFAVPLCLTGMLGFFLFANLGLERASASTAAFVQALTPALTAVLAAVALRERPAAPVTGGIALAVAGAGVLAWGTLAVGSGLGLFFLLLSSLSWAVYTVLGHWLGDRLSAVAATVFPAVLATVALAPVAGLEGWEGASPSMWLLLAGTGFFGSGLAYVLWNFGVARVPASHAGVYGNLIPVVALIVAWLALGESIGPREAGGGAIVILGAALASTRAAPVRAA